jgi:F420-non-reducing hydrogenase iron-sulfur subunit
MMAQLGLNPDRLRLEWLAASEAQRFAHVVREFTEYITKLGPLPAGVEDAAVAREEVHAG